MSYHKFSNLRETFQADLSTKLLADIKSLNFLPIKCNCKKPSKVDGECIFKGKCLHKCLIYQVTCKRTGRVYIGSTQRELKERIAKHNQEVRLMANKGIASDSYARHFSQFFKPGECTIGKVRRLIEVDILWEGNPISAVKTFGKECCTLCMRERFLILDQSKRNKTLLINSNNEFYGACRHRACFHRLTTDLRESNLLNCTDEAGPAENRFLERIRKQTIFVWGLAYGFFIIFYFGTILVVLVLLGFCYKTGIYRLFFRDTRYEIG